MQNDSLPAPSDNTPSDDSLPVEDNEQLMDRILGGNKNYKHKNNPPIQAGAFLPRKSDTDGLSLNRQYSNLRITFLTADQLKEWHELPANIRETCGVVTILTQLVRGIDLTVEVDPASTPGHVLIKEINFNDYDEKSGADATRRKIIEWATQLARLTTVLIAPSK